MLTGARLTFKSHRFEVVASVAAAAVIAAAMIAVRSHLAGADVPPGCFAQWLDHGPEAADSCEGPVRRFFEINEEEAGKVMAAMAVLPFALGLVLGVPLIGRELEHRTATIAWSLSASRRRWFIGRLVPILALALALLVPVALLASALAWERRPWLPPGVGYDDVALHGPIVVARGLLALAIGLLCGALTRRTLPGFIVGAVACLVLAMFATPIGREVWFRQRVERFEGDRATALPPGSIEVGYLQRTPDGRLVEVEEGFTSAPPGTEANTDVWLAVPGHANPELERLEAAVTAAVAGSVLLLVFPVIERRRPI